jgi:dTDP-glucose 4,6-dehydratase
MREGSPGISSAVSYGRKIVARSFHRVLVTGGAGFIGSNYVRYALKVHPEWQITVLDKLTYAGNRANLAGLPIRFIEGDVADPEAVREACRGVEAILNFAAESHVDRSLQDPRPFIRSNVEGTLILLEEARRLGIRFLQVSTDEVYGDLSGIQGHSKEEDPLRPRSPYAASKAAAEHLVHSYFVSYGLDAVLTRGSNTYGPYQYPEKIIPLFILRALADEPLPLYGDGSAVRDYMHVEDHAAGIDLVLHQGASGQAYNLGAREQISGREVAERILDLLGKPHSLIRSVPDRPGHDYRYSVDPSRAEALGWQRRWSFEEGLAATVRWYQEHPRWWD